MKYFVRVAETGSFTRAADVLDLAQSSLSRQIRMLETELRQNLFYRNGRGADLTEAGKLFLDQAGHRTLTQAPTRPASREYADATASVKRRHERVSFP